MREGAEIIMRILESILSIIGIGGLYHLMGI